MRVANRVHSLLADQAENNGQKIFKYQLLILFGTCFEFVVGTKQYLLFLETKYLLMKKINDLSKLEMEIYTPKLDLTRSQMTLSGQNDLTIG